MQTQLPTNVLATVVGPSRRRNPARVRALRVLQRDVPDVSADGRRTRRSARADLSDQGDAGSRRAHAGRARTPRSVSDVPRVRNDVPVGCCVRRTRGNRPQLLEDTRTAAAARNDSYAAPWCGCCRRRGGSRFLRASAGLFRWMLPDYLARAVPRIRTARAVAVKNHPRRVVVLEGCVQRSTTPEVNAALARVLDASDVKAVRAAGEGCCGSLELHLGQEARALATMRANVDALYDRGRRRRGDHFDRERVWRDRQGLRSVARRTIRSTPNARAGSASRRSTLRNISRGSRRRLTKSRRGNDGRVASAVHAAARPEDQRRRRRSVAARRISTGAGRRTRICVADRRERTRCCSTRSPTNCARRSSTR